MNQNHKVLIELLGKMSPTDPDVHQKSYELMCQGKVIYFLYISGNQKYVIIFLPTKQALRYNHFQLILKTFIMLTNEF